MEMSDEKKETNISRSKPVVPPPTGLESHTKIVTQDGVFAVCDLYGRFFNVMNPNGKLYAATVELTENSDVYRITTDQHRSHYCGGGQTWLVVKEIDVPPKEQKLPTITEDDNEDEKSPPPVNTPPRVDTQPERQVSLISQPTHMLSVGDNIMTSYTTTLSRSTEFTYTDGYVIGLIEFSNDTVTVFNLRSPTDLNIIQTWVDSHGGGKPEVSTNDVGYYSTPLYDFITATYKMIDDYPQSLWTASEDYRRGYIDATISTRGKLTTVCTTTYIELSSDQVNTIINMSNLFNAYGISNIANGESVKIAALPFSKLFRVSNKDIQSTLDKFSSMAVPQITTTKVLSIEKTSEKRKLYTLHVNGDTNSCKTTFGFTGM